MARPRTPTATLEARGAFVNHPERKHVRANEPRPTEPVGSPPKYLDKEERRIWKEIVAKLPAGVAFRCDRLLLELVVQMMAKLRARTLPLTQYSALLNALGRLGMTPADRSKVAAILPSKPVEDDPWAVFDNNELSYGQ